jgi:hypothetical protein
MALIISQLALPATAFGATANENDYVGSIPTKDDVNISPSVVYSKAIKTDWYGNKITYYTDYENGVLVGQKLKVGFSAANAKNQSKASRAALKKLQKYTKIKSVKWYTKDSKGKIKQVSTKKAFTVSKSVKGKKLYVEYSYTAKGVPGTLASVQYLGSSYNTGFTKGGSQPSKYEGIASKGKLSTWISLSSYSALVGTTVKATPTTTSVKRYGQKASKPITKGVKYSYQWYKRTNDKKGNYVYTKIKGATKASFKVTKAYEGSELIVYAIAKKAGYYSSSDYSSVDVNKKTAEIEDVYFDDGAYVGNNAYAYVYIYGSAPGALDGATLTADYYLDGTKWDTSKQTISLKDSSSYGTSVVSTKTLPSDAEGKTLNVVVTLTLPGGTVSNNGLSSSTTVYSDGDY